MAALRFMLYFVFVFQLSLQLQNYGRRVENFRKDCDSLPSTNHPSSESDESPVCASKTLAANLLQLLGAVRSSKIFIAKSKKEMDSQMPINVVSSFTSKVSPCDKTIPEGAWQEEESLEVYRRKRAQRPPSESPTEIVKCIKHSPKAGEEVYESVQPRHEGRRELILLEPVRFCDEPPETLYDDYSLYRMEEYVDAGTEISEHDKQPVYYTIQKVEKGAPPRADKEKKVEEEVISPARELDTIILRQEEERKSMERISSKEEVRTAPPAESTEPGPYISKIPIGDGVEERSITHSSETERYKRSYITEEQHSVGRGSEAERSARPCSRCAELSREVTRETPILDRTIYYEREVVEDGKSMGREVQDSRRDSRASSRQAAVVDDEIADANKRVDKVFRSYETSKEGARKLPTVPEEDFCEKQRGSLERHSVEEYRKMHGEVPQREENVVPKIRAPSRASSRSSTERTQFYEKSVHGSPYRPTSTTHIVTSPYYCPHCFSRICSREPDRSYAHEPHTVRVVPVQKERYPLRTRHDNGREPTVYSAPIHETITTERFERIEKVKRVFPATAV